MKENLKKILICIIAVLIGTVCIIGCESITAVTGSISSKNVLLLDAGHGGIDGGAVSSSGVAEKDINLAIAENVKALAEKAGWRVVMTRETDEGLCDDSDGSIRSKKTADLKERCNIIEKTEPDIAVSIHLNSFKADTAVRGVQVFYPSGWCDEGMQDKCRAFAETVQKKVESAVSSERARTPLQKEGVFIFRTEVCPIIIVECGFLSNKEEAELLQKASYQQKLAEGIMAGIAEFTGVEGPDNIRVIDSFEKKNK